jgi:LCP family protein required for cell wall assembly
VSKPEPLPPDGRFGPVERGGRPRSGGPDWRRLGMFGLVVLTVLGLGAATTAGALVYVSQSAIEDVEVPALRSPGAPSGSAAGPEGGQPDVEPITDILNILVVGSDSREGLSDEQLLRLGTEDEAGDLTDTIMLMQLDPTREQVSVLSFPRDLRLTRCDGSVGRVNAAYSIGEREGTGGPECLVTTISDFTEIPIDHFVRVKLAGFVDVVDALGGVTMYLEEPLRDRYAGLDLPAGCITLDGIQALSFVRARRLDDDFGRIARQQRFMREVVREATSVGTLVNLPKLFSLVRAAGRAVETDKGLDIATQRRIAYTLRSMTEDNLDLRTVPGTPRLISGAAYVVAREDQAEQLFAAFRDGELPPEDLGREAPTALTAADVPPLQLLNGAGSAVKSMSSARTTVSGSPASPGTSEAPGRAAATSSASACWSGA